MQWVFACSEEAPFEEEELSDSPADASRAVLALLRARNSRESARPPLAAQVNPRITSSRRRRQQEQPQRIRPPLWEEGARLSCGKTAEEEGLSAAGEGGAAAVEGHRATGAQQSKKNSTRIRGRKRRSPVAGLRFA